MAEFVITTKDGEALVYNTDPATLLRADGSRIDLSRFGMGYAEAAPTDSGQTAFDFDTPVVGKTAPRILKIQVGLGCNYSCSYCSQGGQKEELTSTADAESFDLGWVEGAPDKVEFWGGEPMLYWKKIQALVPKVEERFPSARKSVVTNGTLLTKERVDWLFDHGFSMAISHDGPGQALRGEDPLEDPETRAVWRYAFDKFGDKICINSVITPMNFDLFALHRWFEERLGNVKLNVEDVVTNYGGAELSDADLKPLYEKIREYASSGLAMAFPRIRWSMLQFMETLMLSKPLEGSHQVCGMDRKDQLAVDLNGNVLTCQNAGAASGHKIGTIDDLENVKLDTATSYMRRENCASCPVVHMCYGSCMFLEGKEFESSCRASYWYNRALLEGVIKLLIGKEIDTISGWQPAPTKRVIPIKVAA